MAASSPLPDPKWKIARSFPRFALALAARVHVLADASAPPLSGTTQDVGLGGACVVLEVGNLVPRQKVELEFRLPMTVERLRLRATVRHCHQEKYYGLQFMELEAEQREMIRKACVGLKIV
jgi:c-di-GMP-binding flagellar brake protein YcgR